jgi:subtilisin family serine protease
MSKVARIVGIVLALGALPFVPRSAVSEHSCADKLSPELEALIDDPQYENNLIEVVIQMFVAPNDAAYADVDAIAAAAPSKVEKVRRVYNAIRAEADTIQTRVPCGGVSIRQRLASGVTEGTVDAGWEAHWLGNELTAGAKPVVLREICGRDDVKRVVLARAGTRSMTEVGDPQTPFWNISRIGAPTAWGSGFKGRGAKVGVIDTGVNANHRDLRSECSGGSRNGQTCTGLGNAAACEAGSGVCLGPLVNRTTGDPYWKDATAVPSAAPTDDVGHGTHMLGIAVGRNGSGVAPEANWLACRAFYMSGGFPTYTEKALTDCAEYLINPDDVPLMEVANAENAADVILLPYAIGNPTNNPAACDPISSSDSSFLEKVARMRAMDILPVFPVGADLVTGSGQNGVPAPANYRGAFAVGLSRDSESFTIPAGQASIDPASHSGTILCLDELGTTSTRQAPAIVAPGRGVLAPWKSAPCLENPAIECPNQYRALSGSDVAAAHVAGAATLLRAVNPDLSAERSPLFMDTRYFALDEVMKRRSYNPTAGVGRVDLSIALVTNQGLYATPSPGGVTLNPPNPFYTSEPGIPNRHTVSVKMQNWSPFSLTQGTPVGVGRRGPVKLVEWAGNTWQAGRVGLPVPVLRPGEEATFSFPLTAPSTLSGSYQFRDYVFQFGMIREAPDLLFPDPTGVHYVRVHGRDRALPGSISPPLSDVPRWPVGWVTVYMTNTGTTTWTAPGTPGASGYSARIEWLGGTSTVNVSGVVGPGGSFGFPFYIGAPVADGTYPFRLTVLRDGVPLTFGTPLNSSMPVQNRAEIDYAVPSYWVWECTPGIGCPSIHWSLVLKNTGNRIWDYNYCVKEIRNRNWPHGGLPATPLCLGINAGGAVAPGTNRRFDGYLWGDSAPYGAWYYQIQLARSDGALFGPAPAAVVRHDWYFNPTFSAAQGPRWFYLWDPVEFPPVLNFLTWRSGKGHWQRWDGNSWEYPWVSADALRPGTTRPAIRAWQSPTSGWARVRATFRNPNDPSGDCPNEGSVAIFVTLRGARSGYGGWGAIQSWYPTGPDYQRLRNGNAKVVDTADPSTTSYADPNGFWVQAGDFITTDVRSWDNGECDKTFDNEGGAPLQVWIWQTTPETATIVQ